jgi:hypothetical protein
MEGNQIADWHPKAIRAVNLRVAYETGVITPREFELALSVENITLTYMSQAWCAIRTGDVPIPPKAA